MVVALSTSHPLHHNRTSSLTQEVKPRPYRRRLVVLQSYQRGDPIDAPKAEKEMNKQHKQVLRMEVIVGGIEKFGKGLKDCLSPKQKGDWKDLVLMSLSFAVYVYISQKIVCAYCVWMSMLNYNNQW